MKIASPAIKLEGKSKLLIAGGLEHDRRFARVPELISPVVIFIEAGCCVSLQMLMGRRARTPISFTPLEICQPGSCALQPSGLVARLPLGRVRVTPKSRGTPGEVGYDSHTGSPDIRNLPGN